VRFPNPDEMMGKLKDYMESGMYERGDKRVVSDASLVFMGNVSVEQREEGYVPVEDLTYVLPELMLDSAFIDRLHGLLPSWELHTQGLRDRLGLLRRGSPPDAEGVPRRPYRQARELLQQLHDKG